MSPRYYLRVLWQAVLDTLVFFDLREPIKIFRVVLAPAIAFFVAWGAVGFGTSMIGLTYPVFFSAIIILATIIIVLATSLYFAPAKMDEVKAKEIAALKSDKATLKALLDAKMEITFRSGAPFEEIIPLDDKDTGKREGQRILRRIGVHNSGNKTITGLSVVLAEAEPGIKQSTPIPLHRQHGIGGPVYDLNPGATLYFEVLTTFEDTTNRAYLDSFAIEHSVNMPNYFNPLKDHRFRIEATGNDVPMAYKYFLLRVNKNGSVKFGPEREDGKS